MSAWISARSPARLRRALDAELGVAAEAMDRLRAMGQTLHFEADPERRRVLIEIRDFEGNVLRTIPPSEAVAIAAGPDGRVGGASCEHSGRGTRAATDRDLDTRGGSARRGPVRAAGRAAGRGVVLALQAP